MQKARLLCAVAVSLLCVVTAPAQTNPPQPSGNDDPSAKQSRTKQLEEKALDLAIVGNVTGLVIEGRDTKVKPLTTGQKFNYFLKDFTNPFTFIETSFEAGVDQATQTHQGYGQGAEGYGKRYGADVADAATAEFFSSGLLPSVFHTDPRYYRMAKGNVVSRATYSFSRVLVTRTDSGRHVFNTAEVLGSAASSGISRAYYPMDERNAGDFAFNMASRIIFDGVFHVAEEFWPDVRNRLFHHQ